MKSTITIPEELVDLRAYKCTLSEHQITTIVERMQQRPFYAKDLEKALLTLGVSGEKDPGCAVPTAERAASYFIGRMDKAGYIANAGKKNLWKWIGKPSVTVTVTIHPENVIAHAEFNPKKHQHATTALFCLASELAELKR